MLAHKGSTCSQIRAPGSQSRAALVSRTALCPVRPRELTVIARAEGRGSSEGFLTGFVLGGVLFGALGFLFAPQISKAIIGEDSRLKLPRFMEEEKDPEQTKQDLIEKIASLNASIDEVASKLKSSKEVEVVQA